MGEKGKRFKDFQINGLVWLFLAALLVVRSEVNTKEIGNSWIGNEEDGDQKMYEFCSRFACTINEREWQQATQLWTGTM
ncbi:unnamed protein product [Lactuca virosa]|uniref:Uncharacterized protein n=1 Tax=Lactuca virosa TaxID=75947 RepID=A0AAU9PUN7_9ASTR|nr:unnamed protein product [Lactuca virosa]